MEIALYTFSAIGALAVLFFFYLSVRQVLDNSEDIETVKRWYNSLDRSLDKAHDRYHGLANRVEDLEAKLTTRRK